ncbi:MAG TPA: SGNH family hydrolase [Devosiaceae bacterium]|jgi:hypothetical protein
MKNKSWRLWIIAVAIAALVLADLLPMLVSAQEASAPLLVAQQQAPQKRHRTLFDLLFGDKQRQQQQQLQQQQRTPAKQQPKRATQKAAPAPQLAPPKPTVTKAAAATRIAVFGDSLAVDLAEALDRFYADDPNLTVLEQGVGSSGLVRQDYFDWAQAVHDQIAANSFDLAIFIIGVNDRQPITVNGESLKPQTDGWNDAYTARVNALLTELRAANKPVIWVGLPPMQSPSYSAAMTQITSVQKLASFSGGAEFLDIYEKFADENGKYTSFGPDVNGQQVRMRKDDGIHFSTAGSDKLAFYLSQSIKTYYHGGSITAEVTDPLLGTEAQQMLRPPYQGLGQVRLLEVAGAVVPLSNTAPRANDLVTAQTADNGAGFDLDQLMHAPVGRVDAFGVGVAAGNSEDVATP